MDGMRINYCTQFLEKSLLHGKNSVKLTLLNLRMISHDEKFVSAYFDIILTLTWRNESSIYIYKSLMLRNTRHAEFISAS